MKTKTDSNSKKRFRPLLIKKNSEYISNQIEESIIEGVYQPNERLPSERELASQFAVGRGAVREALRMLDATGIIEVKHGGDGGIYVKKFDSSRIAKLISDMVRYGTVSMREITDIRQIIESTVLDYALKSIGEKDIVAFQSNIERCKKLIEQGNATINEFQTFHLLLTRFCPNRLFNHLLTSIVKISGAYAANVSGDVDTEISMVVHATSHLNQHRAILKAISSGDSVKARKLLFLHLKSLNDRLSKEAVPTGMTV